MDFSKMTGYEFEDYISQILKKIGFSVTQTGYSHDGGIDLLAVYDKPLFCGKYIVQCKNYTGLVGQPEARDLYGVVMSENANKGILITPSDYTEQAYDFAKGKNIELINGDILKKIIGEYADGGSDYTTEVEDTFNKTQYDYLMQCIDNDPTSDKFYLQAIDFLRKYIIEDDPCVKSADIFNKIIDLNTKLIKRCYKKKGDSIFKRACWWQIAEIEIIRGNLGNATNIMLDHDLFYIKEWLPQLHRKYATNDPSVCFVEPACKCVLARNLYAAYKQLGFSYGCTEIIKFVDIDNELKKRDNDFWLLPRNHPQVKSQEEFFAKSVEEYGLFIKGDFDDTLIYSSVKPYKYKGYQRLGYQKSSLNIITSISNTKKYYSKPDSEIINDILVAFKQHGISLADETN